jgi:hypothetical protein
MFAYTLAATELGPRFEVNVWLEFILCMFGRCLYNTVKGHSIPQRWRARTNHGKCTQNRFRSFTRLKSGQRNLWSNITKQRMLVTTCGTPQGITPSVVLRVLAQRAENSLRCIFFLLLCAASVWSQTICPLEVISGLCFRSEVLHTQWLGLPMMPS